MCPRFGGRVPPNRPADSNRALGISRGGGVAQGSDRVGLERLCRYLTRPPLATERLSLQEDGRVRYGFRRPWRDGTTGIVLHPHELIERLAALVPRPRTHLLCACCRCGRGNRPGRRSRAFGVSRARCIGHRAAASGCDAGVQGPIRSSLEAPYP
ncbi:MAG: transposase [Planctomycetota bacterium]